MGSTEALINFFCPKIVVFYIVFFSKHLFFGFIFFLWFRPSALDQLFGKNLIWKCRDFNSEKIENNFKKRDGF